MEKLMNYTLGHFGLCSTFSLFFFSLILQNIGEIKRKIRQFKRKIGKFLRNKRKEK